MFIYSLVFLGPLGPFPGLGVFIATHCFEIIWFGRTFYCILIQSRPPSLP
uniref:Uncharacterized protein n=1 Tax=Anguilla anguilla TaxID=7936 RepID=A0A0E9QL46_ANGAN